MEWWCGDGYEMPHVRTEVCKEADGIRMDHKHPESDFLMGKCDTMIQMIRKF